ncbi:helix-turn-helix domain-containing protein [Candidatus Electronema sp. JM]|uniref:helix-turn-helix domain-containing protein n=1 Tax=Candidatus Electronema sp. JM TaxID=3401571 RepID=UPI003AA9BB67
MQINFSEIWERVRISTEIDSLTKLAKLLGITQPSVSDRKSKGVFPIEWAYVIARKYNLSLDWLLTGEHLRVATEQDKPKNAYVLLIDAWLESMTTKDARREEWFKCHFEDAFPSFKSWVEHHENKTT